MNNADIIKINTQLSDRITAKKHKFQSLRPFPADTAAGLHARLRLQHTYYSNAMAGNTLRLKETKLVVEEGITTGGRSLREHLEAVNTARAFDLVRDLAAQSTEITITHSTLGQVHARVMACILEEAGVYRTRNIWMPSRALPDRSKVAGLMDELLENVAGSDRHPVETASFLHHRLVKIHPFIDGNGRTARLLTNLYLMARDYPPMVLKDKAKYFRSLKLADSKNLTPFTDLIARSVDESLTLYLSVMAGDELLPLKILARDTPYSQEYLSLRARQGVLDAVKLGRTWYASKRELERYLDEHSRQNR